jgi:hypothetical protein
MAAPLPQDWSEFLTAIFSGLQLLVTAVVALIVQRFAQRQTLLQLLTNRWDSIQQKNLASLQNPVILKEFEILCYGPQDSYDESQARIRIHLLAVLNNVYKIWLARRLGIISDTSFRTQSLPALSLIVRKRSEIEYLLKHRGYETAFEADILRLLPFAQPAQPPPAPG